MWDMRLPEAVDRGALEDNDGHVTNQGEDYKDADGVNGPPETFVGEESKIEQQNCDLHNRECNKASKLKHKEILRQ